MMRTSLQVLPARQSIILGELLPSALPGTYTLRVNSLPWNVNLSRKHCLTFLHCVKTVAPRLSSRVLADRNPDLRIAEPSE